MRELIFGTILVGAAGAGVYFMPITAPGGGAGYAMSVKEARELLGKADLREGKLPFGRLEMMVTSPSENVVSFAGSGSFAAVDCRVTLKPVEGGVTADTSCKRGALSDGAGASAAQDLTDLAFAEFVDAALDRRAFDEHKVQMQSAGAVLKNMPKMQKEALEMHREMSKMEQEWESGESANFSSDAEVDAANTDYGAY